MKLVAGRTSQSYNNRKNRKGAFWEDRYHATAVSKDEHLLKCMVYIDMNMVRAGIVNHPADWKQSGYKEILSDKKRYSIIDLDSLQQLLDFHDIKTFQDYYKDLINESVKKNEMQRRNFWSESIAVGNNRFVVQFKEKLGIKSKQKKIATSNGLSFVKDEQSYFNNISNNKITW